MDAYARFYTSHKEFVLPHFRAAYAHPFPKYIYVPFQHLKGQEYPPL